MALKSWWVILVLLIIAIGSGYYYYSSLPPPGVEAKSDDSMIASIVALVASLVTMIGSLIGLGMKYLEFRMKMLEIKAKEKGTRSKMIRLATLLGLLVVVALASAATARVGPPDATAEGGFDDVYVKPDEQGIWGSVLQAVGLAQFEKSYAVVIGISDFEGYNDLSTQQDTIRMRDFLINDANFDYVHTLTGANATKARINELMSDVFPELVGENDRFVFYWSGHGVTRPTRSGTAGYLPLADSPKGKYSTMVAMDDLERWDGFILANHVLYLLDSCFSGLAGVEAKSDVRDLNIAQMVGPSRHVLSAGTGDEEAIVIPELWRIPVYNSGH